MQDERNLIPFQAASLRGERLLVLAPHPDDEILGCGGLLAQHAREHRQVRVVIVTDGVGDLREGAERLSVASRRRDETVRGLRILGIDDVRFLELPDRSLSYKLESVAARIRTELAAYLPDLILAPSPMEIHPDHVAVSRALHDAVSCDGELSALMSGSRVAFFEVSQPLRPNTLVDVTAEAEAKLEALAAHQSQLGATDYAAAVRGLNAYRALTLPSCNAAEAYWVIDLPELRTVSHELLRRRVAGESVVRDVTAAVAITVVIRTRDRPALLREAIESVRSSSLPMPIVVVNDGGTSVREIASGDDLTLIEHDEPRGRSVAMNTGVAAAAGSHVAFLDDDDVYFPDHLETVATAASRGIHVGWYTDAVSIAYEVGEGGAYEEIRRSRDYEQDFDADLLRLTNYVPLTALLVRRDHYTEAGGFAGEMSLFEDWDFLLRLSTRGSLVRVPHLTVAIRHFPGIGSAILSSPRESPDWQEARRLVWQRNGVLASADSVGRGLDRLSDQLHVRRESVGRAMAQSEETRRRLAMFLRSARDSRHGLEEARSIVAAELALHPRRRRRVDAILADALAENIRRIESAARFDDDPGDAVLGPTRTHRSSSNQQVEALRHDLERTRQALDDIHRSALWKVGSAYWRFLHAIGALKPGGRTPRIVERTEESVRR